MSQGKTPEKLTSNICKKNYGHFTYRVPKQEVSHVNSTKWKWNNNFYTPRHPRYKFHVAVTIMSPGKTPEKWTWNIYKKNYLHIAIRVPKQKVPHLNSTIWKWINNLDTPRHPRKKFHVAVTIMSLGKIPEKLTSIIYKKNYRHIAYRVPKQEVPHLNSTKLKWINNPDTQRYLRKKFHVAVTIMSQEKLQRIYHGIYIKKIRTYCI